MIPSPETNAVSSPNVQKKDFSSFYCPKSASIKGDLTGNRDAEGLGLHETTRNEKKNMQRCTEEEQEFHTASGTQPRKHRCIFITIITTIIHPYYELVLNMIFAAISSFGRETFFFPFCFLTRVLKASKMLL